MIKMTVKLSGSNFHKHEYARLLMDTIAKMGHDIYDVVYVTPNYVIAKFSEDHEFPIKGFQGKGVKEVASFIIEELETLVLLGSIEHPNYFKLPDISIEFGRDRGRSYETFKNSLYHGKYQKFQK